MEGEWKDESDTQNSRIENFWADPSVWLSYAGRLEDFQPIVTTGSEVFEEVIYLYRVLGTVSIRIPDIGEM